MKRVWLRPGRAGTNRGRKRLLAYIIEDATLIKLPAEGVTRIHVRFKGGKTETLTTLNPKSSAPQVKTPPLIVQLVDKLLDDHIYAEIADILNQQELRAAHLDKELVPEILVHIWMGHSNKNISQRYARTGVKIDGMFRTMTAQRVGLGFNLPELRPIAPTVSSDCGQLCAGRYK